MTKEIDHKKVEFYTIINGNGLSAEICNYGARLTKLNVPDKNGKMADVVLGFATLEETTTLETYFGAVCGRFANRISNGTFTLDGKNYALAVNNGPNHLHGGLVGYNAKVWNISNKKTDEIEMKYTSPDGEEGYPGTLDLTVTYTLTDKNELKIHYEATTDKPTVIGLTNHSYFNLKGEGEGLIHDHLLQLNANFHTILDDSASPTGEVAPVENSPFDFRKPTRIGDRIDHKVYEPGRGIDNNWVITKPQSGALVSAGFLYEPQSGRKMEVLTTQPGIQIYTGNWIEENIGKQGKKYGEQCAVCLETQGFPNSPNLAHFPIPILRPEEKYDEYCIYKFSVE